MQIDISLTRVGPMFSKLSFAQSGLNPLQICSSVFLLSLPNVSLLSSSIVWSKTRVIPWTDSHRQNCLKLGDLAPFNNLHRAGQIKIILADSHSCEYTLKMRKQRSQRKNWTFRHSYPSQCVMLEMWRRGTPSNWVYRCVRSQRVCFLGGWEFLKNLWCCVCGGNKVISGYVISTKLKL